MTLRVYYEGVEPIKSTCAVCHRPVYWAELQPTRPHPLAQLVSRTGLVDLVREEGDGVVDARPHDCAAQF